MSSESESKAPGSGVWVFKNGVVRLTENPGSEQTTSTVRRKALLHTESNEVVSSYSALESKLTALGWERYYEDPALYQFHKRGSLDLISLPRDFSHFTAVHMYDVVVKNRGSFSVVDA